MPSRTHGTVLSRMTICTIPYTPTGNTICTIFHFGKRTSYKIKYAQKLSDNHKNNAITKIKTIGRKLFSHSDKLLTANSMRSKPQKSRHKYGIGDEKIDKTRSTNNKIEDCANCSIAYINSAPLSLSSYRQTKLTLNILCTSIILHESEAFDNQISFIILRTAAFMIKNDG